VAATGPAIRGHMRVAGWHKATVSRRTLDERQGPGRGGRLGKTIEHRHQYRSLEKLVESCHARDICIDPDANRLAAV